MNTAYSHALRCIICPSCGDVVHGPLDGGTQRCGLCDEEVPFGARNERQIGSGMTQVTETARLDLLETQDRRPEPAPPAIVHLIQAGALDETKVLDALKVWQDARAALAAGEGDAEERFYQLTRLLHRHMTGQDDDLQLRAVLETAIEVTPSPHYRQLLLGLLAREAALVDDLSAADEWLALCDPRAHNLHADSAYRYAAAYVATTRRKYDNVLEVLGTSGYDVPLTDDHDAVCCVLRANAYERLGRLDEAVKELVAGMVRLDDGPKVCEQLVRQHGELSPCRKSLRCAIDEVDKPVVAEPVDPAAEWRVGRSFRVALPWVLASLVFLTLWATTDATSTTSTGQRIDSFFLVVSLSLLLPATLVFWRRYRRGAEQHAVVEVKPGSRRGE
jgi:hypothetical protein